MLSDIYFDDNLFSDLDLKKSGGINQGLIDSWRDYGRLAYDKNKSITQILDAAPVNFRQRWMNYLSYYSLRPIEIDPDELFLAKNVDEIIEIFSGTEILAYILAEGNHELILRDARYYKCAESGMEVFMPSETGVSHFHNSGRTASELDLKDGMKIDAIWKQRFKGLVKYTNKISIIDRYMIKNIFEDRKKKKTTSMEKFMGLLSRDSMSDTVNIAIYSSDMAFDNGLCNIVDIESYLRNDLAKFPYVTHKFNVEINICRDQYFALDAHDRYIAFDKHVIQIGNGVSIFRDEQIKKTSFNIKSIYNTSFNDILRTFSRNREFRRTLR